MPKLRVQVRFFFYRSIYLKSRGNSNVSFSSVLPLPNWIYRRNLIFVMLKNILLIDRYVGHIQCHCLRWMPPYLNADVTNQLFCCWGRIILAWVVNTIPADALAPNVARASADVVLSVWNRQYLGLLRCEFGLLLNKIKDMMQNGNTYLMTHNSLWPNDAIWRHGSGSTLAKVMACCLTAPSHYLNQCWLIISDGQ